MEPSVKIVLDLTLSEARKFEQNWCEYVQYFANDYDAPWMEKIIAQVGKAIEAEVKKEGTVHSGG